MKVALIASLWLLSLTAICDAATVTATRIEDCGWLIENGDTLTFQPDPALKPRDTGPLPSPPAHTKAAYCDREAVTTGDGDERITLLGLPFVIRQGDRIGVLEYPPKIVFNYHWADGKFLPGRDPDRP